VLFRIANLLFDRSSTHNLGPGETAGTRAVRAGGKSLQSSRRAGSGSSLRPRHRERAFPIAAGDVFFQTTAVSVFSAIMLNALPMWRKNCGPHALAELRRKLQEEKAIFIIFPEGGRTRTGSMMPFKHGLGMLVAETNVPVVPCGLIGSFEALPPNRKVPRPVRIKLLLESL
jgi:1-acyl-sn-glycerol-3-phosphate acyltransferase